MGLSVWTVHERNDPGETQVVREGIAWLALIAPALWLFYHRCWLEAILVILLGMALGMAGQQELIGAGVQTVGGLAIAVLTAFEANDARRRALARRGWREAGLVTGNGRFDAERRWFERAGLKLHTLPPAGAAQPLPVAANPRANRAAWAARRDSGDVYGLMPGSQR